MNILASAIPSIAEGSEECFDDVLSTIDQVLTFVSSTTNGCSIEPDTLSSLCREAFYNTSLLQGMLMSCCPLPNF